MLGCHIAREVDDKLQKGLKFRFRESHELNKMEIGLRNNQQFYSNVVVD